MKHVITMLTPFISVHRPSRLVHLLKHIIRWQVLTTIHAVHKTIKVCTVNETRYHNGNTIHSVLRTTRFVLLMKHVITMVTLFTLLTGHQDSYT